MPKIFIDGTGLEENPKGVGLVSKRLCQLLSNNCPEDWRLLLLVFKGQKDLISSCFRGDILEMSPCSDLRRGLIEVPRLVRRYQPQVLLKLMESSALSYPVPTVTFCHDIPDLIRKAGRESPALATKCKWALIDYLQKKGLQNCAYVVCNSQFTREQVVLRYSLDPDRVLVGYCGIDDEFFNVSNNEARNSWLKELGICRFILTFATGDPRENSTLLPEIIARTFERGIEIPFVIAGVASGSKFSQQLRGDLSRFNLHEGKHFIVQPYFGAEDRVKLAELYAAASFYLELSGHEGFGMQLAEAMATGTTCISSGKGALTEVGGGYAVQYDLLEPDNIAACIERSVQNGLAERDNEAQVRFAKRFSWETTEQLVRSSLLKCLEPPRCQSHS